MVKNNIVRTHKVGKAFLKLNEIKDELLALVDSQYSYDAEIELKYDTYLELSLLWNRKSKSYRKDMLNDLDEINTYLLENIKEYSIHKYEDKIHIYVKLRV